MKKLLKIVLGFMFACSLLSVMPKVEAAVPPAVHLANYWYYELEEDGRADEKLDLDEELTITVFFKVVGVPDNVTLDTGSGKSELSMGVGSDFNPRTSTSSRKISVHEIPDSATRIIEATISRVYYRGSGSIFEVLGTLDFSDGSTAKVKQSITIREASNVGVAPAPTKDPYIVKYSVSDEKIEKNEAFDLSVEVVDPNYMYSNIIGNKLEGAYAFLQDENFNAPNKKGVIASVGADEVGNLKYTVQFSDVRYLGPGQSFKFRVAYKMLYLLDGKAVDAELDKAVSMTVFETSETTSSGGVFTPNVLVSNYSGASGVMAGKTLNMEVTFKNMSADVAVRNVIIDVIGGEAFAMAKGVNKFYVDKIEPLEEVTISISVIASKASAPSSYPIGLKLAYDYQSDKGVTGTTSASELSIPIKQVDRVRINYVRIPNAYSNSEAEVNYSVLNTGLASIKNAQLELYDAQNVMLTSMFLGNIEAGKEAKGTNMYVTFPESGEQNLTMKLTYEDDSYNAKEIAQAITVQVNGNDFKPQPPVVDPGLPIEPEKKNNNWLLYGGVIAVLVLIAGFVVYKRKKSKQGVIDDADL